MSFTESFKSRIFRQDEDFRDLALEAFHYQAVHNPVYRLYLRLLGRDPEKIKHLSEIPFMPITFFKDFPVLSGKVDFELLFQSSGTTGKKRSRHYVKDPAFYQKVSRKAFELQYGSLSDYEILALLPSYLQQKDASLVRMVSDFIPQAGSASGFYLNDLEKLDQTICRLSGKGKKILVLGVTFALLDFAQAFPQPLPEETLLMETGGMKGRREELPRAAVHERLQQAFGLRVIHSEYGMTELLSQAYAPEKGIFKTPPWMHVRLRELNDPFALAPVGGSGGIDIIDLANIDSCCFIQTQDIGRYVEGGFEVLGRYDHSDVRGCNLLVAES